MTRERAFVFAFIAAPLLAQNANQLISKNVSIEQTNYRGRSAVRVIPEREPAGGASYALLKNVLFRDGTIEVDLAGQPAADAPAAARGFIGIAFRVHADGRYEYI